MIKLIKTTPYDMNIFNEKINRCDGYFSNHGVNEKELVELLENIIGYPVAVCANATIALSMLKNLYDNWAVPTFTFPATNVGLKELPILIPPILEKPYLGRTKPCHSYNQIITIPFGDPTPGLSSTCVASVVVDAAAAASPDMHIVREWLNKKAFAVVVSLHATKIWPAGEGAFVAFNDECTRDNFVDAGNFGIVIYDGFRMCNDRQATNGKMSEFSACAALASFENFKVEYMKRIPTVEALSSLCKQHNIDYIPSMQTFWIGPHKPFKETIDLFLRHGVETKNYYWNTLVTPHEELCSRGVCIPTHDPKIVEIFKNIVGELCG